MAGFKTVSLSDLVFERLESDIISGVYQRGEILTELKLVETLGVSRTPIREALRCLEQERLIADTGKGSVVLGITLEDLEDIMDIRLRIEGLAAYYAAENLTQEGIERLRAISEMQDFYYNKHDVDNLRRVDDEFHDAIYELCGRSVIHDTLLPLHRKTLRYRRISMGEAPRLPNTISEHKEILEAIISKDATRAKKLMKQHIVNAKKNMMERFRNDG